MHYRKTGSGFILGARLGPGIAFRSVDELIAAAGKLKTLKHGEGLGTVQGDAKEIWKGLLNHMVRGLQRRAPESFSNRVI